MEKLEEPSDKLIDAILASKNENKMPAGLSNAILYRRNKRREDDEEHAKALSVNSNG